MKLEIKDGTENVKIDLGLGCIQGCLFPLIFILLFVLLIKIIIRF